MEQDHTHAVGNGLLEVERCRRQSESMWVWSRPGLTVAWKGTMQARVSIHLAVEPPAPADGIAGQSCLPSPGTRHRVDRFLLTISSEWAAGRCRQYHFAVDMIKAEWVK